ncbi:hypothetical protein BBW65_03440 [Helicobacter enhydrae]|uniref:Type II secretion system protein n=1 Tax=Helicobacter enhydrae TaxID=222136 RepID=A0A1B1U576_9HELI|nr:type II secretion system protein [Helicobacter enhydrae]ANV97909.1 hypothetical protein BBW65_03440 [Helicobacter enhydrae]
MRNAFSMLELVFVIVIIGILSAIAIPKFNVTRTDAQSVSIQSDITLAISAIQREIFANDVQPQAVNIQWLYKTAGFSPSRWIIDQQAITLARDGQVDTANSCIRLELDSQQTLLLHFTPKPNSPLCSKLASFYQNGTQRFPLFSH